MSERPPITAWWDGDDSAPGTMRRRITPDNARLKAIPNREVRLKLLHKDLHLVSLVRERDDGLWLVTTAVEISLAADPQARFWSGGLPAGCVCGRRFMIDARRVLGLIETVVLTGHAVPTEDVEEVCLEPLD